MTADRSLLREAPSALAARIRAGELSSRELVSASLAAIDADDRALGAFIVVDGEQAMAAAGAVDERVAAGDDVGPLGGVPLAVKDNEDAIGFTTTVGSAWRRDDPAAERDSILVAKLRAAGCVVVGKTNTPELAWKGDTINAWGGATANPWSLDRSAGGSSGGSAAAVAAGLVPLATASDGGGSIRIPASVCGLTGFKPSLGRVASGGPTAPGWPDLSTKGLLTSRLAGAIDPLDVVLGPDPTDLRSLPRPETPWPQAVADLGTPLRVAWSPTMGFADVDAEILAACERAVGVLADLGAEIEEVPSIWVDDPVWDWLAIVSTGNARTLDPLRGTPAWDLIDPGLAGVADYGAARSGVDVLRGIDAAHRRNLALVEVFHRASILLCPTVAGQTAVLGGDGSINGQATPNWIQLTYGFNLTRSPAGTVCAGFTADGMPIGLQVVGPQHGDVAVLRCLLLLEQALGVDTIPPAYRA